MMTRINSLLRRFRREDDGVTLVEYGIALVLAVTVGTFLFNSLGQEVLGEMTEACTILQSSGTSLATSSGC